MNNRKKFVATVGPNNSIKLFEAETGRLHRMINVSGQIAGQPVCTDNEVCVAVISSSGQQSVNFYSLPGGNLSRVV